MENEFIKLEKTMPELFCSTKPILSYTLSRVAGPVTARGVQEIETAR